MAVQTCTVTGKGGKRTKHTDLRKSTQSAEECIVRNRLSSVASLTTAFQTASGSNISARTVHQELHEMGFQAPKPKIAMCIECGGVV